MDDIIALINPDNVSVWDVNTMIRFLLVVLVLDLVATIFSDCLAIVKK